jgi:hypothetical protein
MSAVFSKAINANDAEQARMSAHALIERAHSSGADGFDIVLGLTRAIREFIEDQTTDERFAGEFRTILGELMGHYDGKL